jgi:hypothetical protein
LAVIARAQDDLGGAVLSRDHVLRHLFVHQLATGTFEAEAAEYVGNHDNCAEKEVANLLMSFSSPSSACIPPSLNKSLPDANDSKFVSLWLFLIWHGDGAASVMLLPGGSSNDLQRPKSARRTHSVLGSIKTFWGFKSRWTTRQL